MAEENIVLLRFNEAADALRPSDTAGGLEDLGVETGLALPAVVDAYAGYGRQFGSGFGLIADDIDAATLLTRNVSVQVLVSWDAAAQLAAGTPGTVVCRGLDGSSAEYYAFGLELRAITASIGELRWFWQDNAGTIYTQTGGHFQPTTDYLLLTATRRWQSSTEVVLRYYVNDRLVAEVISTDSAIGGGTTGTFAVGARKTSGTWGRWLEGVIDELMVTNYELSAEEIELTWARLSDHQPAGGDLVRGLLPPGAPYSDDPASRIQRLFVVMGQALGYSTAVIENMRRNLLPDRAYGAMLERWERILRQPPKGGDSRDRRRTRLVAFMQQTGGSSTASIQAALAPLFGLDAADVELLEFSTVLEDPFDSIRTVLWSPEPSAAWSVVSGEAQVTSALGSDLRWDASHRSAARMLLSVSQPDIPGDYSSEGVVVDVKLSTYWAALPDTCIVGLMVTNFRSGDAFWYGVQNVSGTRQLGYVRYQAGALDGFTALVDPSADAAYWLRLRQTADAVFSLEYSDDGITYTTESGVAGIADFEFAGVGAMATDAATGATLTATFDDFVVYTPEGARPYNWYAYRNTGLPGVYDLVGAKAVVRRMTQAHMHGAAILNTSVLCDDNTTPCDSGPLGGI